jgi:hypothetical protein
MKYDAYGRLTTRTTRVPAHEPRRARSRAADRARRSSERVAPAAFGRTVPPRAA